MQEDREYSVYPSDLDVHSAFRQLIEYLKSNGYKPMKQINKGYYLELSINEFRTFHADSFEEFIRLLEKYPNALPIHTHYNWYKKKTSWFSAIIKVLKSGLEVCVKSDDLDIIGSIHDRVKTFFQASNPREEFATNLSMYGLKKSIFLAHRFDEYGNEISGKLSTFLGRLGFDVKEGSGYETKNIPDKVAQKIRSQDIFICVFTPGDTSWILSETSFAKALNKYIVIICDSRMDMNKGIIGNDYEHLSFPEDVIEKCYTDLLYCLPL